MGNFFNSKIRHIDKLTKHKMIPPKTKITIVLNKNKTKIRGYLKKIREILDINSYLEFGTLLKQDFCFLLDILYSDYPNREYEVLFISGLNEFVDEFQLNLNPTFEKVLANWGNLDSDRKTRILSYTTDKVKDQNYFNSIKFIVKKDENTIIKDLTILIIDIVSDLVDIDNHLDQKESESLERIKEIIGVSLSLKEFDFKNYLDSKLIEYSIKNDDKFINSPSELKKLIIDNQKLIFEIEKKYVHDFLKIHTFLKIKNEQVLRTFKSLNENTLTKKTIDSISLLLFEQLNSYNTIYYYSLNMIVSLLNEDLFTFYQVYDEFDELGVFKNKFEREMSESFSDLKDKMDELKTDVVKKLSIIENQLEKVIQGINQVNENLSNIVSNLVQIEQSISDGFNSLNHNLQNNFDTLNKNLNNGLNNINSTVSAGNLINAIGVYQTYKINKNTRSLRSN